MDQKIAGLPDETPIHKSVGVLRYTQKDGYGYRLVLACDQAIMDYYRDLLPFWKKAKPQRYPAHVSIVRREVPVNLDAWGLHEGEEVEFDYTGRVFFGTVYCWLNVFCKRLEEVRLELGLPVSTEYTRPPDGFTKCFHLTIGNYKENPTGDE